ncbi:MAG: NAD-dependent epimerase/dehydratase family protein [Acidobacteriaceae bacterium]
MSEERFIVTGALGCIGAWTVRNLIKAGVSTAILDTGKRDHRLRLLMTEDEISRLATYRGDISDLEVVHQVFDQFQPTNIIHLAALQLPFCKADPSAGARVNVVGTVNIFEAAIKLGIRHLAYASSTAVYGLSEEYPSGLLSHQADLKPRSHYGVYKQANEGTAKVYFLDDGISSIGLRPYVVYGPGRDQGMTSTPTKAMLAAATGRPYRISYGGRYCFQYADDVANQFIAAARQDFNAAEVFNIGGASVSTQDVISAIEKALPASQGLLTYDDIPLPFPQEVDNAALNALLGRLPETTLEEGVRQSLSIFKSALENGIVKPDEVDLLLK